MLPTRRVTSVAVALAATWIGLGTARAQDLDLYTGAPAPVRAQEQATLPWLERLERDLAATRSDARRVHYRSIAQALVLAGDANGAVAAAAGASTDEWLDFVQASVEERLAANDVQTATAMCLVLERSAGGAGSARSQLVRRVLGRATALVGRESWSQRVVGDDAELAGLLPLWLAEGRVRRGPSSDAAAALTEIEAIDADTARRLAPLAARRALAEGRLEICLGLLARCETITAELRADAAAALWRVGRREEALARLAVATTGAQATVEFARNVDVPSDVLDALLEQLGRRDLEGRGRLARAVAGALAREGDGREAWRRASQLGALTPLDRFELALDFERGGDEGRATTLAASDPWSAALLELRRGCERQGVIDQPLARAADLARGSTVRTLELCQLLAAHGRGHTAGEIAVAAIAPGPATIDGATLVQLVRIDLAATGGLNIVRLHDAQSSPAARLLIACAAVESCLAPRPRL